MKRKRRVVAPFVLLLACLSASPTHAQERVSRQYDASPLTRPAPLDIQPRVSLASYDHRLAPWERGTPLTSLEIESMLSFMVPPALWEADSGGSLEIQADTLLLKHSKAVQESFREQLRRAVAVLAPTWQIKVVVYRKRPEALAKLRGFRWLRASDFELLWRESERLPAVVVREARRLPLRRMPYVGLRDAWTFIADLNVEVSKGNAIADPELNVVADLEGMACGFVPGPRPDEATFAIRLIHTASKRDGKIDVRISKDDPPKLHQIEHVRRRYASALSTLPVRSGDAFALALHGTNAPELTVVMRVQGPSIAAKELRGDTLVLSHAVLSDKAFRRKPSVTSTYPRSGEGIEKDDYEPGYEQLAESLLRDLKETIGSEGTLVDTGDALCVRGSSAVLRRVQERADSCFAPFGRAFIVRWIEEELDANRRWQDRVVRTCLVSHGRSAAISDSSEQNYVRDYNVEIGGGMTIADPVTDWIGSQRELSIQLDARRLASDSRVGIELEAIAQDLRSMRPAGDKRFVGIENPRVVQRRFTRSLRVTPGKRTLLGRGPARIASKGEERETRFSIEVEAITRPVPSK